jgi:8-oxo-dGTP diphosphatase
MEKPTIKVAAAVIYENGKFLCMQRCRSTKDYISEHWEFPGGKIEEGETGYDTLLREIREEMAWQVFVGPCIGTVEHDYPDFHISLTAYLCRGGEGEFKMYNHLDYKWLTIEELPTLKWTEADRKLLELL